MKKLIPLILISILSFCEIAVENEYQQHDIFSNDVAQTQQIGNSAKTNAKKESDQKISYCQFNSS